MSHLAPRALLRAAPLALLAAVSALAPVACASSNTSPPPAAPAPDNFASFGVAGLSPGSRVMVSRNNQWLPASVVRQEGAGRFVVHYEGFGPEWDEAVGMDRIRPQQDATQPARDYRAGEKVLVKMQNRLLLGDVVQQVSATAWRVHYDGYGPEVAENVGPERMRRPHVGASARNAGQAVGVDVGAGRIMAGKVIAVVAPDRWLVRYDGFGPEYDQEVGADRIREATAKAPEVGGALPPPPPPVAAAGGETDKAAKDKPKGKDAAKDKAAKAPPPAPAPPAPLQVGDAVLVSHRGGFHPAKLAANGALGGWRVKYDNAAAGVAEEDVAADRVLRMLPPPKGVPFAPNTPVFVEWHGLFVAGKVLKESDKGQYKVRFDGLGPESDEVVQHKRLRPRP